MALRARIGDVVIEADTEGDARMLLIALGVLKVDTEAPASRLAALGKAMSENLPVADKLKALGERRFSDMQRQFIHELLAHPPSMTDKEIRTALGAASNGTIAGLVGGLSKHAKGVGLRLGQVLRSNMTRTPQGVVYKYALTQEAREVFEKSMGGAQPALRPVLSSVGA